MENKLNSIILLPIFVILLMVVFCIIKESLKIDEPINWILSICVSILATFALNANPSGTIGAVLLPYKAVGISILVIVLMSFLFKGINKGKERSAKTKRNRRYDADGLETDKTDDDRVRR